MLPKIKKMRNGATIEMLRYGGGPREFTPGLGCPAHPTTTLGSEHRTKRISLPTKLNGTPNGFARMQSQASNPRLALSETWASIPS